MNRNEIMRRLIRNRMDEIFDEGLANNEEEFAILYFELKDLGEEPL